MWVGTAAAMLTSLHAVGHVARRWTSRAAGGAGATSTYAVGALGRTGRQTRPAAREIDGDLAAATLGRVVPGTSPIRRSCRLNASRSRRCAGPDDLTAASRSVTRSTTCVLPPSENSAGLTRRFGWRSSGTGVAVVHVGARAWRSARHARGISTAWRRRAVVAFQPGNAPVMADVRRDARRAPADWRRRWCGRSEPRRTIRRSRRRRRYPVARPGASSSHRDPAAIRSSRNSAAGIRPSRAGGARARHFGPYSAFVPAPNQAT